MCTKKFPPISFGNRQTFFWRLWPPNFGSLVTPLIHCDGFACKCQEIFVAEYPIPMYMYAVSCVLGLCVVVNLNIVNE